MKSTRSVVSTYLSRTTYSWKASLKASSTRKGANRITSRAIKNEVGIVQSPNKREERKSVPYSADTHILRLRLRSRARKVALLILATTSISSSLVVKSKES